MPGYFYYIAVAVIGLALAAYVIFKRKSYAKLITFYLFAGVVADCGEILVLILFNAYSYKLGLFTDIWANNILGHILPNSTLWPAVAVFIAAYKPRFRWIITFTLVFVILDILFIQLGVYQHNWWQTWMTAVAIFAYCLLMRFWYSRLEDGQYKALRFITFSFVFVIITFLPDAILLLNNHEFCRMGLYTDKYRDSIFSLFLVHAALAPLCIFFLCILRKWYFKLIPFIILYLSDVLLVAFGVLNFYRGWNVFYSIIIRTISLLLFIILEKKYSFHNIKFQATNRLN